MLPLLKKEFPLLLASFFGLGLVLFRSSHFFAAANSYGTDHLGGFWFFLIWNLFLAWIPLGILYLLRLSQAPLPLASLGALLWLLFLPNAPYLITDLIHLRPQPGIPLWFDAFVLFYFAWLGLQLALRAIQDFVDYFRPLWGRLYSTLFVGFSLLLSGLGIYLGRVQRWNSWDVFFYPEGPLRDSLMLLRRPLAHAQDWLLIISFSVMLSICYWVVRDRQQLS